MTPMLLTRYAKDGSEKARRQMLALCQTDPEILADVLGHLVALASEKLERQGPTAGSVNDYAESDEITEILEDVQEALALARRQGVLLPVRVTRILAGEGTGQFSSENLPSGEGQQRHTVPLAVALDYVGTHLESSRHEINRLINDIDENNRLCNSMENEIAHLLQIAHVSGTDESLGDGVEGNLAASARLNIDSVYANARAEDLDPTQRQLDPQTREAFWRELDQSEDSFDAIARFFARGVIN
jgi:hypothetical protein